MRSLPWARLSATAFALRNAISRCRQSKKSAVAHDAEFTHGGRQLGVTVVAATLALTVLGTPHIMGIFELSLISFLIPPRAL